MTGRRPEFLTPPRPAPGGVSPASILKRLSRKLLKLVPAAAILVVALAAIMLSIPGCPTPKPQPQPPATMDGIPEIRVSVRTARKATLSTTGPYRLFTDDQLVAESDKPLPKTSLTRGGRHWYFGRSGVFVGAKLSVVPAGDALVAVDGKRYRGRMALRANGSDGFRCVNRVDVESYLAGVLRKELFPHWEPRAYQVQAIAARTFALYKKATFGARNDYDVSDDQSSQVYGGVDAETDKSRRAVRATHGIVLATGPDGDEKIFSAHYSSCCGGTTNNVAVLYGPPTTTGPLVGGRTCRDCAASKQYRWPAIRIPKRTVHRGLARRYPAIAAMPAIKALEPKQTIHGRAIWVDVVGSRGRRVKIRTEDLRLALLRDGQGKGLYSMNCAVRVVGDTVTFGPGRGFGHGVGMCQWGVQGMVQRGCTVEQVLRHYYPDSKLFQAYR